MFSHGILPAGVKSPKKKQNSASVGDDQNSLDKDEDLLVNSYLAFQVSASSRFPERCMTCHFDWFSDQKQREFWRQKLP